ncbi:hypothetical protein DFQ28_001275 [Apophysomyces sp. BC1034]|nr:hypothetical protein DFQ28_001275 [Apophysomyces sp. BC1034]
MLAPYGDIDVWRVGRRDFVCLPRQHARQREPSPRLHLRCEHRCHQLQRIGQDVGHDHVEFVRRAVLWQPVRDVGVIVLAVVPGRVDRLRVDVDADYRRGAKLVREYRQDARAASIVEQRVAGTHVLLYPFHAKARGRMTASAESESRIELQYHRIMPRRLVPRRHHPDSLADVNRLELRLREPHPVLLLDVPNGEGRLHTQAGFVCRGGEQHRGILPRCKQRDDARVRPRVIRCEARLAEQRLLVRPARPTTARRALDRLR